MTPRKRDPLEVRRELERVANLYRIEMTRWLEVGYLKRERSPRPRSVIAEELGIHPGTAGRRIQEARAAGLLGPALRTRAGEKEAPL